MRVGRVLAAGTLAVALGLSGCGSEGDPEGGESTPTDQTTMDESEPTDSSTDMSSDEMSDEEDMSEEDDMSDEASDDETSGDDMSDEDASDDETSAEAEASGPDFTATTVEGEPFDAASLAGKPTVLWFWAPWCHICAGQAPAVKSVAAEHEGEVTVVGVAGLAGADDMPDFVSRTDTGELTHLSDPDGAIWRMYDIAEQSTYVLLDSSGEPVDSGKFSDDELADKVAALG